MIDFSKELNGSQSMAVRSTEGNSMVIAGAGSGKTRVLTYRIAHLLETGVEPSAILALTFTNKAAGEMKQRIQEKVGAHKANYLWMGTFHSIFSRILRCEAQTLGYTSNYSIYDSSDSANLVKSIVKEMQLDEKVYKPQAVLNRIQNAKNRLVTAEQYVQDSDFYKTDLSKRIPMTGKIYQLYTSRLRQADAMDFDDLLLHTYLLFRDHPQIHEKYGRRFTHILVDEYQDTNYAQHSIVWQLTRFGAGVCVVGDDAQSIYSFRGANVDNMLDFTKLYKECKVFKLEQNYRSTQTIVCAANSLIEKNRHRIKKTVFSVNEVGDRIGLCAAQSDLEESGMVAQRLAALHAREGLQWNSAAVLYRTNAQSRSLEEALRRNGIPYRIYGSLSFYQRKEVKDVIAYFRMAVNPSDEEAFKRIINFPARGIGQTTLGKIQQTAHLHNVSLWSVMTSPTLYGLEVNSGTAKKLADFSSLVQSFIDAAKSESAYPLAKRIIDETGITAAINSDSSPEGQSRKENVEELMAGLFDFSKEKEEAGDGEFLLSNFLSEVSLLTDRDTDAEEDTEKVTLMTVHASKGLEYDTVFIVGMEENLFPSCMSTDSEREVEEERRLFYVAMTRAKRSLTLLYARSRFKYGQVEYCEPSRFLKDIDPQFLQRMGSIKSGSSGMSRNSFSGGMSKPAFGSSENRSKLTSYSTPKNLVKLTGRTLYSNPEPVIGGKSHNMKPGDIIEHDRFGVGKVLVIDGVGEGAIATVQFTNVGTKKLLLKFAKYQVLKTND